MCFDLHYYFEEEEEEEEEEEVIFPLVAQIQNRDDCYRSRKRIKTHKILNMNAFNLHKTHIVLSGLS